MLPLIVGSLGAVAVGVFAHAVGYDRDRAFYATVLTVVGMLYVLFAVIAGGRGLMPELAFFAIFAVMAAVGFKWSMWIVAAGLALHGLFDFVRYYFLAAPGAPSWWPGFCGSYDAVAAVGLGLLILARGSRAEHFVMTLRIPDVPAGERPRGLTDGAGHDHDLNIQGASRP